MPTGSNPSVSLTNTIKEIALKKGNSERVYRNTIFYLVCSEAGLSALSDKLKDYLACTKIIMEYSGRLEKDQNTEVQNRKREYETGVNEALIRAYNTVIKYSAKEGIESYILKNYASVKQVVAATVSAAAGGQLDEATVSSKADEQIVTMTSGLSQAYQAYNNCNTTLSSLEDAGYFDGMSDLNAGIKSANSGATQLKAGIDQLSTGAGQLSAGSKQLKAGLGTLSTGLNTLSTSVGSFSTYKEGTLCSSLYALNLNAGKLHQEGTAVLQSGLSQLTANTATLKDSSGTLADGVTQLNEGAITLKDGMAQFNSEAIEPITKLVDSDAQTAVDTIKAVVKAGQEYNSFLGKSDDKAGSVTFVYKTAGITANK